MTNQRKSESKIREVDGAKGDVATANPVGVAADVLGVLDSIDIPVVVVDRDCKVENNPIDYRFLEVNQAFQRQTGIIDARGRLMREIAPSHEQHWFDIYGRIALTGETLRFENPAAALRRHFEVCAFRVGAPGTATRRYCFQ